jgi:hypothetical protein
MSTFQNNNHSWFGQNNRQITNYRYPAVPSYRGTNRRSNNNFRNYLNQRAFQPPPRPIFSGNYRNFRFPYSGPPPPLRPPFYFPFLSRPPPPPIRFYQQEQTSLCQASFINTNQPPPTFFALPPPPPPPPPPPLSYSEIPSLFQYRNVCPTHKHNFPNNAFIAHSNSINTFVRSPRINNFRSISNYNPSKSHIYRPPIINTNGINTIIVPPTNNNLCKSLDQSTAIPNNHIQKSISRLEASNNLRISIVQEPSSDYIPESSNGKQTAFLSET